MASKTLPFPTAWQSVPDIPHLRYLHRHLKEAVAGVGRARPLHIIRQIRLAPGGHYLLQVTTSQGYLAFTNDFPVGGYPHVVPCCATIVIRVELLSLYPNGAVFFLVGYVAINQHSQSVLAQVEATDDVKPCTAWWIAGHPNSASVPCQAGVHVGGSPIFSWLARRARAERDFRHSAIRQRG